MWDGIETVERVSLLGRPAEGEVDLVWHALALRWFIAITAILVMLLFADLFAYSICVILKLLDGVIKHRHQ